MTMRNPGFLGPTNTNRLLPTRTLINIKMDRFIHRKKPTWVLRAESNRWKRTHGLSFQVTPSRRLAIDMMIKKMKAIKANNHARETK